MGKNHFYDPCPHFAENFAEKLLTIRFRMPKRGTSQAGSPDYFYSPFETPSIMHSLKSTKALATDCSRILLLFPVK